MQQFGYLQLVSQSAFSGISVSDIRTHLNITDTSTDSYIQTLLDAAVYYCERRLGLDLRPTTWNLVLDCFPVWTNYWMDQYGNYAYQLAYYPQFVVGRGTQQWQHISLKRGPLTSVVSVKYYDTTNTLQTMSSSDYTYVNYAYQPGRVEPVNFWPIAYPRPDAVTIQFVTGFSGAWASGSGAAGAVPPNVIHAIKLLVGQWWVMRESAMMGANTISQANEAAVNCLLSQFEVINYG
jgi:hypothetical protein